MWPRPPNSAMPDRRPTIHRPGCAAAAGRRDRERSPTHQPRREKTRLEDRRQPALLLTARLPARSEWPASPPRCRDRLSAIRPDFRRTSPAHPALYPAPKLPWKPDAWDSSRAVRHCALAGEAARATVAKHCVETMSWHGPREHSSRYPLAVYKCIHSRQERSPRMRRSRPVPAASRILWPNALEHLKNFWSVTMTQERGGGNPTDEFSLVGTDLLICPRSGS